MIGFLSTLLLGGSRSTGNQGGGAKGNGANNTTSLEMLFFYNLEEIRNCVVVSSIVVFLIG